MRAAQDSPAEIPFDCLLLTRPEPECADLAGQLDIPGLEIVLQPAHQFSLARISAAERQAIQSAVSEGSSPLMVFTSTRAVHFALQQLPLELLAACQLCAIGPATAAALQEAGLKEVLQPESGYRSEDLLRTLDAAPMPSNQAWIVAAAGGRRALLEGFQQRGLDSRMLLVYQRKPATVTPANQQALQSSQRILSVWTSADAMQQLSQGLSSGTWQRVCAGEWLVVSQRLAGVAASYHPAVIHQASGPGNMELAAAIEKICRAGPA